MNSLYKYRPINKTTITLLANSTLYFSSPSIFNDPFDCNISVHYYAKNKTDLRDWLQNNEGTNEIAKQVSLMPDGLVDLKLHQIDNDSFNFKILCFSKSRENILLWSHYSDEHKGICLQFDVSNNNNKFYMSFSPESFNNIPKEAANIVPVEKVDYTNDRPKPFNGFIEEASGYYRFFLAKSICWEYEEEYRILMPTQALKTNPVIFNKDILTGIIFGTRTPKEDKELIYKITKPIYPNLNYYQALINPHKYTLDIIDYAKR